MKVELNEKFPVDIQEEGTLMDFVDNEFVFVIKDERWSDFELKACHQQSLQIDFVYKYDIAIFLLTLQDAIDTSDFIFSTHDNTYDESLFKTFERGIGYGATLYLIDKDHLVKGRRKVQFSSNMSNLISEKLTIQKAAPYVEEEFLCNLEGLQSAYEPFEMQPLAYVSETFKA